MCGCYGNVVGQMCSQPQAISHFVCTPFISLTIHIPAVNPQPSPTSQPVCPSMPFTTHIPAFNLTAHTHRTALVPLIPLTIHTHLIPHISITTQTPLIPFTTLISCHTGSAARRHTHLNTSAPALHAPHTACMYSSSSTGCRHSHLQGGGVKGSAKQMQSRMHHGDNAQATLLLRVVDKLQVYAPRHVKRQRAQHSEGCQGWQRRPALVDIGLLMETSFLCSRCMHCCWMWKGLQ